MRLPFSRSGSSPRIHRSSGAAPRLARGGRSRASVALLSILATVAVVGTIDRLASARDGAERAQRNGWIIVGESPMRAQIVAASAAATRMMNSPEVGKLMQALVDAKPADEAKAAADVVNWMSSEAGLASAGFPKGSSIFAAVGDDKHAEPLAQTPRVPGGTPGVARENDPLNCWHQWWMGRWIRICVGTGSGKTYAPW